MFRFTDGPIYLPVEEIFKLFLIFCYGFDVARFELKICKLCVGTEKEKKAILMFETREEDSRRKSGEVGE